MGVSSYNFIVMMKLIPALNDELIELVWTMIAPEGKTEYVEKLILDVEKAMISKIGPHEVI